MNRKEQRDWVFKLIFENQISEISDIKESFKLHELDLDEDSFVYKSLEALINNKERIEDLLLKQIGDSQFKRLSKVDKSILYLSLNEMFNLDIPVSVSINEAVNLSKDYSNKDSYKFVNSVLGNITRKEK